MFSTLESSWDKSARRGWSAAASFGFQAMAVSLLLMVPLIWVQGPPRLQWLQPITTPITQALPAPLPVTHSNNTGNQASTPINSQIIPARYIPRQTPATTDGDVSEAPDVSNIARSGRRDGVPDSLGTNFPAIVVRPPAPVRPLKISHWSEGNVIYRVQPSYPPLARQARIQGAVQLRAIISKTGMIEHLTLENGHPMLAGAAIDAVRQWRYRPYLLNDEPVEIETEITVNFVLSGS